MTNYIHLHKEYEEVEVGGEFGKDKEQKKTTRTIMDADYGDDMSLLANTPTQAESLLYNLERVADGRPPYQCRSKKSSRTLIKEATSH